MNAAAPLGRAPATWGPFLWGPKRDALAFAGSAAVALALVFLAPRLEGPGGALPAWGFVALVIGVDVAHVWSTLFRTYLDGEELRRRPLLYAATPLACFAVGIALHASSALTFWRVLAYIATFHFVRQQVGWVAVYRRRAGDASLGSRVVDEGTIYLATGYPLLEWHVRGRAFSWFVAGDFIDAHALSAALPIVRVLWLGALAIYAAKAIRDALTRGAVQLGKHLVVATTAITWYVGIIIATTDFAFTAANVIVHGVPYAFLLYAYARARRDEAPASLGARVIRFGVPGFVSVLFVIAFAEEMLWDRLAWHAHMDLFGDGRLRVGPAVLAVVVPLLAVPQATHYVLDAVLWRRRAGGAAQAQALGFESRRIVE